MKKLLLTLFYATQLSVNIIGMEDEIPKLLPEIQGNIITTLFSLYVNDIENVIDNRTKNVQFFPLPEEHRYFSYTKNTDMIFSNIMHWIECTRFNPLQKNICFNYQDKKGNTILHHTTNAMLEGYHYKNLLNFTRYLLEHNANPNIHNKYGHSAFFACMRYLKWYNDQNAGCSKGMQKKDFDSIITLFLDNHASPNKASQNSACLLSTLLPYACSNSMAPIIKNTDMTPFINYTDHNGNTLILLAVKGFDINLLHKLHEAGADFNIKTPEGLTLLEYALKVKKDLCSIRLFYPQQKLDAIETIIDFIKKTSQVKS